MRTGPKNDIEEFLCAWATNDISKNEAFLATLECGQIEGFENLIPEPPKKS